MQLDAEVMLEPVDELPHRALQLAVFIDVGKGRLARDDDCRDDGVALEEALFFFRQAQFGSAPLSVIDLVEMTDEVRPVGDELIGREVELAHEFGIVPPHGEVELVDAIGHQLTMEVGLIAGPAHHQAREEHGLCSLLRLDDAGQDIDITCFQALLAFLPSARHEDDLAARITAERLHEIRLHAVEIAG